MYGEARRERWGHSHLRKIVSAPSGPSLHAFLSLSDEADPHTSLTIVRRRCGRVGFPLGSHPWMLTVVHRRYGFRRVNVECTQADDSFYTTTGMNEKGKSQSERARRRGRADGVSRLFNFRRRTVLAAPKVSGWMTPAIRKIPVAAQEAPSVERTTGRVPQPVLSRRNMAPTFKPEIKRQGITG